MSRAVGPFFDAPNLLDNAPDGSLTTVMPDEATVCLTVGSDLLVQVETDADGMGWWLVRAFNCNGDHLADLATARDRADAMAALPLAVDTAVRLFPTYLTIPR